MVACFNESIFYLPSLLSFVSLEKKEEFLFSRRLLSRNTRSRIRSKAELGQNSRSERKENGYDPAKLVSQKGDIFREKWDRMTLKF